MVDNLHNPDVLSCLANLSNDEVFTPPSVVNQMLDMLPRELFRSGKTTFLDIGCKSGVFLREITKRLIAGLADEMPDLQTRVDHILHKQVFGIATTELTSLVSRRTLYCSKYPNCRYSTSQFKTVEGNIRFRNIPHTFVNGRCKWCGASEDQFGAKVRKGLETHAYEFIHTDHPEEIFKMKFDVIVGNPPYQLATAGDDNGAQAKPIYQKFVQQAIKLNPRNLIMITPSRWFVGGWGLDVYRDYMLSCNHIRVIHDYPNSEECFSGVDIKGGVSYFHYSSDYTGPCRFVSHEDGKIKERIGLLKEDGCDVLVRNNELMEVFRKARKSDFVSFSSIVSERSPYGLNTNHVGEVNGNGRLSVKYFERTGWSFMKIERVTKNHDAIKRYKLFVPKAAEDGRLPGKVIGRVTCGMPNQICSGTYLMVGPFDSEAEMNNARSYMMTKYFRALVAVNKISQDCYAKVYAGVPLQDFSKPWTDAELYAKYKLSKDEIAFIESMIKPME